MFFFNLKEYSENFVYSANKSNGIQIPVDCLHCGDIFGSVRSFIKDLSSLGKTEQVARLLRCAGRPVWSFFIPSKHLRKLVYDRAPLGKGVV